MRTARWSRCLPALLLLATAGCDRFVDRQVEKQLTRVDHSVLTKPEMQVVLCGTGSPLPDKDRASACTAVIAGGVFVLVDVGPGAWKTVDLANLPTGDLSAVLLTHFHSDHIGDLGETITQSWIAGRKQALDVYGPVGTAAVVDGFTRAYAQDVSYRVRHHGEDYLPHAAGVALAHDVALGAAANADAVVFEKNGLKVTMFRVDHTPVEPAVGYRFDYRGRSVVVSGDTRRSASVAEHARGVDILVHEALQPSMTGRAVAVATRLGMTRLAKLAGDIPGYHTTPAEAAALAQEAGVKHLVLTHLVPGPYNFLARRMFMSGVSEAYKGEVTLGEDGLRFELAPADKG